MDERELVLTSLIYPLIFRETAQIGIATPIAAHIRELLKIQTPELEVTKIGLPVPVTASVRNLYQKYDHPLQDFAQIGVAKPVGAYFKNLFNEYIHPHSDFAQIGNAIPVSMYSKNMLQNLQTFKTDHVVQISNAIPEAVYSTCKPVVFAPTNLRGRYNGTSIQLFWSNNSLTHSHQNLYRSTTPFTVGSLPPVYQYIFRGVNSYIDEDVVEGVTYYYAVSTEAGLVQLVSDITEVLTWGEINCDPHLDKVVSLLHFDTDFFDIRGEAWITKPSNVVIQNDLKKFGQGALQVSGRSANIFYSTDVASKNWATQDFTVEAWINHSSPLTRYKNIFVLGNGFSVFTFVVGMANENRLYMNVAGKVFIDTVTLPAGSWYHLAFVRSNGSKFALYLDGVELGSLTHTAALINRPRFHLCSNEDTRNAATFTGAIDEVRITLGVARYTENFTPPTEPFPNFGCITPQLPEVIGEEFGGGFYIGDITIPDGPDAGTYAIIMAGVEGQVTAQWKTSNTETADTDSYTNGLANTQAIQALAIDIHPAGKHCLEYRGGGFSDWYLPAADELDLTWINRGGLAGLAMEGQRYWSSTQDSAPNARFQAFSNGTKSYYSKNYIYRVRPVRRIRKPD